MDKRAVAGKVYLVGAGPGDPGLLTLKGRRCLEDADVVVYDYLVSRGVLDYTRAGAQMIYVGKRSGGSVVKQEEVNRLIVDCARDGKVVVRLKGGDPFVLGRGGEEAAALAAAGIDFEVVPGVTSAVAVPAYAGIPVTHRDLSSAVTIVTGHKEVWEGAARIDWQGLARGLGTVVFLMGTRQLRHNMARLLDHGLSPGTPVALVRGGTGPDQETLEGTAADIADRAEARGFEPPAVVVVGDVVRLRGRLRWFETKPLFGRRVLVTRARHQARAFADLLESQGATVILLPTIEIKPPEDYGPLDRALAGIEDYDWVVFTSVNGVGSFCGRLDAAGKDLRGLGGARIAAIGPETARALRTAHLKADALPTQYRAEALLPALGDVRGLRILLPRAAGAREVLPEELRRKGAEVDDVPAYRTGLPQGAAPELRALLAEGKIDLVTFTSPSTVRHFVTMSGGGSTRDLLGKTAVGCIGPVTAEAARARGLEVHVQPEEYAVAALTRAIVEHFTAR